MGRAFGKYQLSKRIGVGATAEVFDATRDDGEEIVVKRILPQRASDPQFMELFEREAQIVRELSHPNVVALLDFGELDHSYYLALEKVDGGDLAALIDKAGAPPPELAVLIAREIANALAYVHQQTGPGGALVHRDVSPENVLLSHRGEVKLTDFGIAKHGHDANTDGKAPYLAPEREMGNGHVGPPADVYSLGAMLVEMLGNRSAAFEPLLSQTLALNPSDRPSAKDVVRALDDHLSSLAKRPTASDLGAWVTRSALLQQPKDAGVDLLALHLLGESAARPLTAVFATPQPQPNEAVELPAQLAPPKKQIRVSLTAYLVSIAATAIVSVAITKATIEPPPPLPAPPAKLIAVSPVVIETEPPPAEEPPKRGKKKARPVMREVKDEEAVEGPDILGVQVGQPEEPEEEEPPPRRPRPKRPKDFGTLSINSIPWANVFVDGELKGATPLETSVAAGRHEIVLRSKSGKVIKEFTTEVGAGETRVHSFDDGTR